MNQALPLPSIISGFPDKIDQVSSLIFTLITIAALRRLLQAFVVIHVESMCRVDDLACGFLAPMRRVYERARRIPVQARAFRLAIRVRYTLRSHGNIRT